MRRILVVVAMLAGFGVLAFFAPRTPGTPRASVSGELVETFCWGSLHVGGPAHASCGIECAKRGIPVAVYDAKTRKATILLPGRDKGTLPTELIEAMGQQITVHGESRTRGGIPFLLVQSWKVSAGSLAPHPNPLPAR